MGNGLTAHLGVSLLEGPSDGVGVIYAATSTPTSCVAPYGSRGGPGSERRKKIVAIYLIV